MSEDTGRPMNDREMLLFAYGALAVAAPGNPVTLIVKDHLFPEDSAKAAEARARVPLTIDEEKFRKLEEKTRP
jgi:hypothetical protein